MIAHFDVDAFYASVAQRDDPSLRGKPLAIAGSSRRAVVLTASYEARPFGVRSALPLFRARELCPQLVVRPPDFARYHETSRQIFAIFAREARAVEGLSMDEAFVDAGTDDFEAAVRYAQDVRAAVRSEVGLTVSAGVATQKMVAKIASDSAKPDGLASVVPGTEAAYLAGLSVSRLWGVGPKTQARLSARGISTIGEVAALDDDAVFRLFGRWGIGLRDLARGHDTRHVESERETQSVSSEETFEEDIQNIEGLCSPLRELCADVSRRLVAHRLRGRTIGVKVKRADFTVAGRQQQVAEATDDAEAIYAAALACLHRVELGGLAVRLLGVRVAGLAEDAPRQMSLLP
ncbi:MAG: DNA polymerase IV [Candidatus Eremiobacteraeota bacterium]|nr:DNA polymerase IV [Candidatus Eremiobacteraeota bacterium]